MSDSSANRTRRPLWRVLPLVIGLGGAALLQHYFGAHSVELLVVVPAAMDDGSGVNLRLTRADNRKLIVQVQQMTRSREGHTIVVPTKLPRGKYRTEAWLQNASQTPLESEFEFNGEDLFEVQLQPRAKAK